jgi:hypothetical protein
MILEPRPADIALAVRSGGIEPPRYCRRSFQDGIQSPGVTSLERDEKTSLCIAVEAMRHFIVAKRRQGVH